MLRSAGALLTIHGLVGSEDSYWGAYQYLRQRASKMDYARCRRLRLPIRSGAGGSGLQGGFHATLQAVGGEMDPRRRTPDLGLAADRLKRHLGTSSSSHVEFL